MGQEVAGLNLQTGPLGPGLQEQLSPGSVDRELFRELIVLVFSIQVVCGCY